MILSSCMMFYQSNSIIRPFFSSETYIRQNLTPLIQTYVMKKRNTYSFNKMVQPPTGNNLLDTSLTTLLTVLCSFT